MTMRTPENPTPCRDCRDETGKEDEEVGGSDCVIPEPEFVIMQSYVIAVGARNCLFREKP
jgi:hypothetical protein